MKHKLNKIISILLCLSVLFTFNISNIFAAESDSAIYKVVEDNDHLVTVMAEYNGDELYATYDKLSQEITMTSVEKSTAKSFGLDIGKDKISHYNITVDRAVKGDVSAIAIDKESSKEYKIGRSADKVQAQAVIAVPLIEWLGSALLSYLLQFVAIVIVSGTLYLAASSVMDKIKSDSYSHYAAYTVPGDAVYIGGAISYSTAVTRMRMGEGYDVFSKTSSLAYAVAKEAGYGVSPEGAEIHDDKPGEQYWHYHAAYRMFGTHSFFAVWG